MNHAPDDPRRRALGDFIRSRRERTAPEMVGLPAAVRRRTPGLRREEVAMLSGIGVTWYTWLEQGRPINVSAQVLAAIARVLRMDDTERAHLFTLAEIPDPLHVPRAPKTGPAVQALLDQIDPFPAVVVGPRWEILASNLAYRALIGDYTRLPEEYQNSLMLYFVDARWRQVMGDWCDAAPRLVGKMRAAMAADVADPGWQRLLKLLQEHSPEFVELWQRQDVASMDSMTKTLHHQVVGTLRAEVVHTWLGDQRGVRLSVYAPLDEATRLAYAELVTVEPVVLTRPDLLAAV
ncbi:MAG: helix-turn-helix domain-containing protein [Hamadaea sp.]|nr:helix-turn-helix domain-containing protein [Hamadaea sp.]